MLKTTTVLFLIALSVLSVLHYIALSLFLYWQVWWFDIPMHFLGGITVALGLYTLVELRLAPSRITSSLVVVLTLALGIAVSWEVFQYVITDILKPNYVTDTVGDVALGLLGASVGYVLGRRLQASEN